MTGAAPAWTPICDFAMLEDPGAKGFRLAAGQWPLVGFVVRKGAAVYAYRNTCPHAGMPLEWKPDAFLTRDRDLIMCSAHGAIFEIETGMCVGGPCPGRRLQTLPLRVNAGVVEVYDPD